MKHDFRIWARIALVFYHFKAYRMFSLRWNNWPYTCDNLDRHLLTQRKSKFSLRVVCNRVRILNVFVILNQNASMLLPAFLRHLDCHVKLASLLYEMRRLMVRVIFLVRIHACLILGKSPRQTYGARFKQPP